MENLAIRFVFDRRGKTKDDPKLKAPVHIEVYDNKSRKKAYVSTGVKITKEQYSPNGGFSVIKHPNAAILKSKAHNIYNKIEEFINSDKCNSIKDVQYWDQDDKQSSQSLIQFMKDENSKENLKSSSQSNFNSFMTRLEGFGKITNFRDLTYSNIADFDAYLKKFIKSQPTIYKRHTTFRFYIKIAIRKKLWSFDPYNEFPLKRGKHKDPTFLTVEEIKAIQNYDPSESGIDKMGIVKDLFLFQCFTGLAFVDMQSFSRKEVIIKDGLKIVRSSRTKTDENYIFVLLPEAEEIAEKYNYNLPKINNPNYNLYLKALATGSGIKKPITSHMGRHTFATYLLNKGIKLEVVSKAIGHSNTKQTEKYAHLLGQTVIDELKTLIPKID